VKTTRLTLNTTTVWRNLVPADVLEDAAQLEPWMRKAIEVAAKARQGKRGRHIQA
jgi:hypothetical protein